MTSKILTKIDLSNPARSLQQNRLLAKAAVINELQDLAEFAMVQELASEIREALDQETDSTKRENLQQLAQLLATVSEPEAQTIRRALAALSRG